MKKEIENSKLRGARVLVVEDQYLIADDLRRMLTACGVEVLGPIGRLDAARAIAAAERIDAALLDIDLKGAPVYPLVEDLRQRSVPYAYLSGYCREMVPADFAAGTHLEKPIQANALAAALQGLLMGASA
ncbi:MAG TPA: response regulator [Caulobacterales bacterium]|nr:response regulator [Caulobacterales bacterium]